VLFGGGGMGSRRRDTVGTCGAQPTVMHTLMQWTCALCCTATSSSLCLYVPLFILQLSGFHAYYVGLLLRCSGVQVALRTARHSWFDDSSGELVA
jgi:hypothetical protein